MKKLNIVTAHVYSLMSSLIEAKTLLLESIIFISISILILVFLLK